MRRDGAAAEFVDRRLALGGVSFPLSELVKESGLSVIAASHQLRRLGARVTRVSRVQPFFLIVPPQHRPMGAPPLEWWLDDYFDWLGHPYYLALLSAAERYGAAPQAVQVHQVMTDTPRREIAAGRLRVRFFVKRRIHRTPVRQPRNAYAPLQVSTPEATALDLVRYASRIGGMGRAMETMAPLLPRFRRRDLQHALEAEGRSGTAQRLGYLLEQGGDERLAAVVSDWLPSGMRWVRLGPGPPNASRCHESERWKVIAPVGSLRA
jgi:hypothetical protein